MVQPKEQLSQEMGRLWSCVHFRPMRSLGRSPMSITGVTYPHCGISNHRISGLHSSGGWKSRVRAPRQLAGCREESCLYTSSFCWSFVGFSLQALQFSICSPPFRKSVLFVSLLRCKLISLPHPEVRSCPWEPRHVKFSPTPLDPGLSFQALHSSVSSSDSGSDSPSTPHFCPRGGSGKVRCHHHTMTQTKVQCCGREGVWGWRDPIDRH